MLPVATPPNAIVFSAAKMNPVEMVICEVISEHQLRFTIRMFRMFNYFSSDTPTDESWLVHEYCLRYRHLRVDGDVGKSHLQRKGIPRLGCYAK